MNRKDVSVEDGCVRTGSGFSQPRRVRILSEELFYNKRYEPFRVLLIKVPLEGGSGRVEAKDMRLFPGANSATQYRDQLRERTQQSALDSLDTAISEFNRSYIVVKAFLKDAASKVNDIVRSTSQLLSQQPPYKEAVAGNKQRLSELQQAVKNYVAIGVHDKVHGEMRRFYSAEDDGLRKRAEHLKGTTSLARLGVKDVFQCPQKEAAEELKRMGDQKSPVDKLSSLRRSMLLITRTIERHMARQREGGVISNDSLTTDDLLPIVVWVVIQAVPKALHTDIVYMSTFLEDELSSAELGFNLVTLQAAVQFMHGDQLVQGTRAKKMVGESAEWSGKGVARSMPRWQSVPTMPTATALQQPQSRPPAVIAAPGEAPLGDFLSSLRSVDDVSSNRGPRF